MVASHGRYDCIWPLGAVNLDCVKTVAFEGTADEMWPRTVVDRRADAATVSAIASGSQHRTMNAISHRIARSESVSIPSISATYLIGAASVSICRPLAAPWRVPPAGLPKPPAASFRSLARPARALRWASMADRAV